MKKKEPMVKLCERCNAPMTQPRWANGKLDSTFANRKFCSTTCAGFRITDKPAAGRKRAQRLVQTTHCQDCGVTETLQRHHIDRNPLNNEALNIKILCQPCHTKDHMQDGTWGHGAKGGSLESPESQLASQPELTDLKPSVMDKSPCALQQHGECLEGQ